MANFEYFEDDLGADCLLRMVKIPAGQFVMGSPANELQRQENEGPQHEVTLEAFHMGCYPITQRQWQLIAALRPIDMDLPLNPSHFLGDEHPVEQVSWQEAMEFCHRLSQLTQRAYRLPSEAQWEYACRAGTQTAFHGGASLSTDHANYDGTHESSDGNVGRFLESTMPVGQGFAANGWGVFHCHGNVREWCLDHWHDSYRDAPSDGSPWMAEQDDGLRVRRGGSWNSYPWYCRSAARYRYDTQYRANYLGFRVVCEG